MRFESRTFLTRISHRLSIPAWYPGMSTALHSVGFLDVLSSTPAESSRRAPCIHARLPRLTTKPCEKCGLKIVFAGLTLCLMIGLGKVSFAFVPFQQFGDNRVEIRSYILKETNESIQYALFVSSKVKKKSKNPLIVMLHGYGASPALLLRGKILDLAQDEGYILVAPMGYSTETWFGADKRVNTKTVNGKTVNIEEMSEKDVMNVLDIMRHDYNVDENRTYLMGASAGGTGAFYLGVKYASNWAAIAAIAPATRFLQPAMLDPVKDTLPVIVTQGDQDTTVQAADTQRWVREIKTRKMTCRYIEMQGGTHMNVMDPSMPYIFSFFKEHAKPAPTP
jgi:poly(3-hydroxybutyrate) depolymerase